MMAHPMYIGPAVREIFIHSIRLLIRCPTKSLLRPHTYTLMLLQLKYYLVDHNAGAGGVRHDSLL